MLSIYNSLIVFLEVFSLGILFKYTQISENWEIFIFHTEFLSSFVCAVADEKITILSSENTVSSFKVAVAV